MAFWIFFFVVVHLSAGFGWFPAVASVGLAMLWKKITNLINLIKKRFGKMKQFFARSV